MNRLRSILYTPGHRADLIAKAMRAGADAVCLVLEDSVPRDRRGAAREVVADTIAAGDDSRPPLYVKVNALERDGLEEDLSSVVREGLAGLIVPKLSTVEEVREVDRLVAVAEARAGLARGTIEVLLLVETPRAVVAAFDLATAAPRVASLVCAAAADGDLAGALGLEPTPSGVERLYVMSKVLVDARAAGFRTPLDGVWAGVGDLDGLVGEAERARALGYRGKLAIHPEQVGPINRVFTPTSREVAHSRRVVAAFEEALGRGEAAIVVDGRMIDYAMVETARRTLELADELSSFG